MQDTHLFIHYWNAELIIRICRRILEQISVKYFDLSGYYTIVLTENVTKPIRLSRRIFADLWAAHIINVNILWFKDISSSAVYTFFPYTKHHCDNVQPVLWDYFVDGHFTKNKSIFASKLDNFHGCPLALATHHAPPYVIIAGTTTNDLDGIEGTLFKHVSSKLNFRTVIYPNTRNYSELIFFEMVGRFG